MAHDTRFSVNQVHLGAEPSPLAIDLQSGGLRRLRGRVAVGHLVLVFDMFCLSRLIPIDYSIRRARVACTRHPRLGKLAIRHADGGENSSGIPCHTNPKPNTVLVCGSEDSSANRANLCRHTRGPKPPRACILGRRSRVPS